MNTIKTNELRKGDWIKLRNGWTGEVVDNRRGNLRQIRVHGYVTEIGDQYAHNILAQLSHGPTGGHVIARIEHTPSQHKLCRTIAGLGW